MSTTAEVIDYWSIPDQKGHEYYGQLSLVIASGCTDGSADTDSGTDDVAALDSNDGLWHPDESEYARRCAVAYAAMGEVATAEKRMRQIYLSQTGKPSTSLPHRHPDIAGSTDKCAICAAYGASTPLMGKLLTNKLESIPRVHRIADTTLYRRGYVEPYLTTDREHLSTQDMYEMFGDYWWDTLSFAIGVSTMPPRDLAELALLLPAAPGPFSGTPASIAVRWLTDAALIRLRQLASHRSSWAAIRARIVAEIDQRSRGSREGTAPESLDVELWRMKTATSPRRELVADISGRPNTRPPSALAARRQRRRAVNFHPQPGRGLVAL